VELCGKEYLTTKDSKVYIKDHKVNEYYKLVYKEIRRFEKLIDNYFLIQ
jgi:hypothetical protein